MFPPFFDKKHKIKAKHKLVNTCTSFKYPQFETIMTHNNKQTVNIAC